MLFSFCSGLKYIAELLLITSTLHSQSAAVMGKLNSTSKPAQIPANCMQYKKKDLALYYENDYKK